MSPAWNKVQPWAHLKNFCPGQPCGQIVLPQQMTSIAVFEYTAPGDATLKPKHKIEQQRQTFAMEDAGKTRRWANDSHVVTTCSANFDIARTARNSSVALPVGGLAQIARRSGTKESRRAFAI